MPPSLHESSGSHVAADSGIDDESQHPGHGGTQTNSAHCVGKKRRAGRFKAPGVDPVWSV
jgi:hypothetical protein